MPSESNKVFKTSKKLSNNEVGTGQVHRVPADLRLALLSSPLALTAWNSITRLARNEWICWVTSVKKDETRKQHIDRAVVELIIGKRRPCCWPGCPHR